MSSDRTEKASPRRRHKAEQEGDRPRSRDLVSAAALLGGSVTLGWAARMWAPLWKARYVEALTLAQIRDDNADALGRAVRRLLIAGAAPCLLIVLSAAMASLAVAVVQNRGISMHPDALAPKWSRLNPAQNWKQILSTRALVRLGKSLVPVAALGFGIFHQLRSLAAQPVFSLQRLPESFMAMYSLLMTTAWIMFGWSLVDYIVEWRQWESRLKMSKQEMREEFKETEGNPQMKGRIRSLQRQMRRRTLRADIRRATVVITNPTHFAVALSFDMNTMEAPKVLAKGRDLVAAEMREEARWAGVPLVENPPLARSLYRTVEAGQSIPAELYAAVAAILAYLYRLEAEERMRQQRGHGAHTSSAAAPMQQYAVDGQQTRRGSAIEEMR